MSRSRSLLLAVIAGTASLSLVALAFAAQAHEPEATFEDACAAVPGRYQVAYLGAPTAGLGSASAWEQTILIDTCTGETWGLQKDASSWRHQPRTPAAEDGTK